jgi:hypothetical protein
MADPLIAAIATDSADAAMFAAALAAGDSWEWQAVLDGITDIERGKRLLSAMGGLYVRHVTAVCQRTGEDPAGWLHDCAVRQAEVAAQMQAE